MMAEAESDLARSGDTFPYPKKYIPFRFPSIYRRFLAKQTVRNGVRPEFAFCAELFV